MGVTAGIFLASILLKEMRYLVYIRYLWLKSATVYMVNGLCCRLANPGRLIDDDEEDIYLDDDWTWNGDKRLGIENLFQIL